MIYKRQIFDKLLPELETKEIMVITGMRRVGKTTALNYLYDLVESENKAKFDFENPLHRKIFEEENYDTVWNNLKQFNISNQYKSYLFLDEVQNLPTLSRVIKYLYDHWDVKFVLTGSSSYYLRNLFPESLSGRKIVFEMYPLNFSEFLIFKNIDREVNYDLDQKAKLKNKIAHARLIPYYEEYIAFGGFPSVVLEENQDRKMKLISEIFTSYFEIDAKNLSDFRDISKLRDLILMLAVRVGSRLDINKLAKELSVSRETVYNYISFLEQTYFISLLSKFSSSVDRQAAGSKKLYFCDSGVAGVLGRLSEGAMFEQSVFQNLRERHKLSYYNKGESNEIDFIMDEQLALEAKVNPSRRDLDHLRKRVKSLKLDKEYIISLKYSDEREVILAIDL